MREKKKKLWKSDRKKRRKYCSSTEQNKYVTISSFLSDICVGYNGLDRCLTVLYSSNVLKY